VIFGSFGSSQYSSTPPLSDSAAALRTETTSSAPIAQEVSKRTGINGSAWDQKVLLSLVVLLGAAALGATLLAGILLFSHRRRVTSHSFDVETAPELEPIAPSEHSRRDLPSYSGSRDPKNPAIGGSARPE
jgi:hypothetical protein